MRKNDSIQSPEVVVNKNILKNHLNFSEYGEESYEFAIKALPEQINYYLSQGNGLYISPNEKIDIITELRNIDDTPEALSDFFDKFGFYTNCKYGYEAFNKDKVIDVKKIICELSIILCELNSNNTNYDILLSTFEKIIMHRETEIVGQSLGIPGFIEEEQKEKIKKEKEKEDFKFDSLNGEDGIYTDSFKLNGDLLTIEMIDSYRDKRNESIFISCYEDGTEYIDKYKKYDFITESEIEIKDFPDYKSYHIREWKYEDIPFSEYINFLYAYSQYGSQFTLNVFSFFYHLSNNHRKIEETFEIDALSSKDLDDLLKKKLKSLCYEICYGYINKGLDKIQLAFDIETNQKIIQIPNLLSAIFYNLYNFDYSKFTYAKCKKATCGRYFIKPKNNSKALYCCSAHARSEAQAALRERQKQSNLDKK